MSIRRRLMMRGGKGSLPYDTEVEYLESTGTQYIDTGVKPDATYTFDTKVAVLNNKYNCIYWGCRTSGSSATNDSQCYLNSNTSQNNTALKRIRLYSTTTDSTANWNSRIIPSIGVMYHFTGITVVSTMQQMSYPITLFAFNIIGSINSSAGICRIGLFTAYSNGVKVMDMIPVRVGQVGYMYDKVSGQLFGNAGTGSFILGPDILGGGKYLNINYLRLFSAERRAA